MNEIIEKALSIPSVEIPGLKKIDFKVIIFLNKFTRYNAIKANKV